jgi:hypothetical protein
VTGKLCVLSLQLFGLLLKQSLETLVHWFNQDWTTILRTLDQMIFEIRMRRLHLEY